MKIKSFFKIFISCAACALLFPACASSPQSDIVPASFDTVSVCKKIPLFATAQEPSFDISVAVDIPSAVSASEDVEWLRQAVLAKSIGGEYVAGTARGEIEKFVSDEIASYKKECGNLALEPDISIGTLTNVLHISAHCTRSAGTVFLYEISREEFRGGAHGLTTKMYFNLDCAKRKIITLKDVFTAGYEAELTRLLIQEAMAAEKVSLESELSCHPEPTENFALLDDGILFYFNQYDIAPYVRGPIALKLSYKKLGSILR